MQKKPGNYARASGKWLRERASSGEPRGQPPVGQGLPRSPTQEQPPYALFSGHSAVPCSMRRRSVWNSFSQSKPFQTPQGQATVDTPSCFGFLSMSTCSSESFLFPKFYLLAPTPKQPPSLGPGHWQCLICSSCLASPQGLLEDLVAA